MKEYFEKHINDIQGKISDDINIGSIDQIVNSLEFHLNDNGSKKFQEYYFAILTNENNFFTSNQFFRDFKKKYSLQGIDLNYLSNLEQKKERILKLIQEDKLADLYFDYFAKAQIKHGSGIRIKNLGSFFAKLVHSFKPTDYCALDNPIKNYFGLHKESFFVAHHLISQGYKRWSSVNLEILQQIRQRFKAIDQGRVMDHDKITDLKLLDLIYWDKANNT